MGERNGAVGPNQVLPLGETNSAQANLDSIRPRSNSTAFHYFPLFARFLKLSR